MSQTHLSTASPNEPSVGTEQPHTPDRINDDWTWYAPILEEHTWFLDTYNNRICTTEGGTITKSEVALKVAAKIEYEPEQSVSRPNEDTYAVGSIAAFDGAIEAGDILPLPDDTTIKTKNGLLIVTEEAVKFNPVESDDQLKHPSSIQQSSSNLRPQDRNQISVVDCFNDSPTTFIKQSSVTNIEPNEPTSTDTPQSPTGPDLPPTERKLNPVEPITPEYTHTVDSDSAIEPNTLKVGDSRELLKDIRTESVQLACFSPPYNIGKDYNNSSDDVPIQTWYSLMEDVFEQLFRTLKPDGKAVVNIGKSFAKTEDAGRFMFYPLVAYIKEIAKNAGFDMWDEILWEKRGFAGRGGGALMGSYPSPSNMMITQTHEHIIVFRKWANEDYFEGRNLPEPGSEKKERSKLTKSRWREITKSIWEVEPVTQSNRDVDHNAIYPEEIPKRIIQLYTFVGDTVLDPFIGTGTTAIAAKKADRDYIGFDTSEDYINHAEQAVNDAERNAQGYIDERGSENKGPSQQELGSF